MAILISLTALADEVAVGASSAQFTTLSMVTANPPGVTLYALVANCDLWAAQGTNPTATAGAGSVFVPARSVLILDGANGAKCAVLQDSTGGKASLIPLSKG